MRLILLFLLVILVVEIALLIKIGGYIGTFGTIAIILGTAVIGLSLAKREGVKTVLLIQKKMSSGQLPLREVGEGVSIFISGIFLVTPGFFTDILGFFLLFPPTRKMILSLLFSFATANLFGVDLKAASKPSARPFKGGMSDINIEPGTSQKKPKNSQVGTVIEGEYSHNDSDDDRPVK